MNEQEHKEQLEQCYSVILSLFAAIDQSVSKEAGATEN